MTFSASSPREHTAAPDSVAAQSLLPGSTGRWFAPDDTANGNAVDRTPVLAGKRVVIVEDEGVTQLQLQMILRRTGMLVVGTAATGDEAVGVVLREKPDLVLMDVKMPGEVDGLEATRQILSQYSVCVVMLTAYDEHRDLATEIGASGYVLKPITSQTLVPDIQTALTRFYQSRN
jgi:CheY-like chemotaxis protein